MTPSSAIPILPALYGMLIQGHRVEGSSDQHLPILNPATGQVLAKVAHGTTADIHAAVESAHRSFERGVWRRQSLRERADVLFQLVSLIRHHREELAYLETSNTGKALTDARDDIDAGAATFQYYAGILPSFVGATVPVSSQGTGLAFREPVGVSALILPWNYPFLITCWKLAPALAMGNSVVIKPAETTPLTALRLGELALEAGIPEGVVNVVPGLGPIAGAALVKHPLVRKVSFTGSTRVGSQIMQMAAADIKRVTLELGGKSATLVFEDADLEQAAGEVFSVFGNAGQDCCARSRMLVQRSVYDEYLERFTAHARAIRLGNPLDPTTQVGSLISREHRARVHSFVQGGSEQGAKLQLGGQFRETGSLGAGSFYEPTIFTGVHPDMVVMQEEIFGPVTCIMPFDTEREAIELANYTTYGLAGSIWTRDVGRALRVAREVHTGTLSVNSSNSSPLELPFGGVKRSGIGRELGAAALEHYSEWKTVFIQE